MTDLDKRTLHILDKNLRVEISHAFVSPSASSAHMRLVSTLGISPILEIRAHSVIYADEVASVSSVVKLPVHRYRWRGFPRNVCCSSCISAHIRDEVVHTRVYIASTLNCSRGIRRVCLTYRDYFPRPPFRCAFASKKTSWWSCFSETTLINR